MTWPPGIEAGDSEAVLDQLWHSLRSELRVAALSLCSGELLVRGAAV